MKNFTQVVLLSTVAFFLSIGTYSQTIDSENFETGWGIWNDGGSNAARRTIAQGSPTGSTSIRLINGTTSSLMTTDNIDLSAGYGTVEFSFLYHTRGYDIGETFEVQYNSGSGWATVATFTRGTDFNNGTNNTTTLVLSSTTYTFNATSRFRIRGFSNRSNEGVYVDNTLIEAFFPGAEINVIGNANNIADGDITPSVTDNTDFGNVSIVAGTMAHTFTIENLGNSALNLTDGSPYINITGAHAADFTVTAIPSNSIAKKGSTTFQITFDPSAAGVRTASVSIANNDTNENPFNFNILGTGTIPTPEINLQGNGVTIANGDVTPSITDDTDFGDSGVIAGSITKTYTIQNLGLLALNLTDPSPYITISGTHASDFTLTANPTTPIAVSSSTTFNITFNASDLGIRTATISIANDDSDENPYTFNIQGNGIDACGTFINTFPSIEDFETASSWVQDTGDDINWTVRTGPTPSTTTGPSSAGSGSTYIYTEASSNTNKTANYISPCFGLSGVTNPRLTFLYHMYGANTGTINVNISTDGGLTFPTNLWTKPGDVQKETNSSWIPVSIDLSAYIGETIKIRIQGITGSGIYSDMAIDKISITTKAEPTIGPGGVVNHLGLWLKANSGLSYTDGQSVSLWEDQGRGSDGRPHKSGQEPIYYDNPTKNVNFNPVIEFNNTFSTFTLDADFSHDNTSSQFLTGDFGYYTNDIFVVIIPDDTTITNSFGFMDVVCGDSNLTFNAADTTGIGLGDFTGRISNEIISYAYDSYTRTEAGDGYAVAEIGTGSTYSNIGIINARNNAAITQQELFYNANNIETTQNDVPEFANASDTRFWLGRSEGWEATTNGRIVEVISYSARKTDTDLTQERNKIQSYLAIKYGITLGVNGTTQDYVDSDGTVIWDQSSNLGFNYDIAGIGRDDASGLNQKQSKSVNTLHDGVGESRGLLTIGLTDIYDTNNQNISTNSTSLANKQFLTWGNNNGDLNAVPDAVNVDMSAGIPGLSTMVSFTSMDRVWKVIENGGDIPVAKVSIPQAAVRNISPPGSYLMFISETGIFDPTADYRVMTSDGNGNLEAEYDFNGTKFITFGYAPEVVVERSIYFDGAVDYIDIENNFDLNPTEFTISAWVKRGNNSANTSILSKRNAAYSEGYDYKITSTGHFEMSWKNGSTQTITSNTVIPENQWHQIAIIYNGTTANLYIDGVLDKTETLSAPISNSQDFLIAAADGYDPATTSHFEGNIDEVRIWNKALTIDELRFIMNQEIVENTAITNGKIMPTSISKYEINSLPWSNLQGYYPMSVYTYTNTKDASGNGRQGALRNLDTVDFQTAPLPYESNQNGDWNTSATWENGNVQAIPGSASIVDNTVTVDWNIVRTTHNVTMDNSSLPAGNKGNRSILGLFVDSNELTVDGDNSTRVGYGLTVTHYLKLDGTIDLEGESQLIQTIGSDLDVTSSGTIQRDQQGTADTYTYNYWSSPIGVSNTTTNNNNITLASTNIFRDGTTADTPAPINFITSGFNGSSGGTLGIADYWIWKFANNPQGDYSQWEHVRSSGSISAGEGFTMKGPGSGSISDDQNYIFQGKPNNGTIQLTVGKGNGYLVGNPYPSAIDANQFLIDNASDITGVADTDGTLYFWEHWGGGSHVTREYQGGYGIYNLGGSIPPASQATTHPDVATGGLPTKTPGRYIPVGQGFFVTGLADPTGTIEFNNGQRVFQKEDGSVSTFLKSSSNKVNNTVNDENLDTRLQIRLGFNSVGTYRRQLLLTEDENATLQIDRLYDGALWDYIPDDIYWLIESGWFGIQSINAIESNTALPIGIHTATNGKNTITIDELRNIPDDMEIYVHDKTNSTYHDLRAADFEVYLDAGQYYDRFEITFARGASLGTDNNEHNNLQVHYNNDKYSIVINNPTLSEIESVELFNVLGQSIVKFDNIEFSNYTEIKSAQNRGVYIIKLKTLDNQTITKKVLIK